MPAPGCRAPVEQLVRRAARSPRLELACRAAAPAVGAPPRRGCGGRGPVTSSAASPRPVGARPPHHRSLRPPLPPFPCVGTPSGKSSSMRRPADARGAPPPSLCLHRPHRLLHRWETWRLCHCGAAAPTRRWARAATRRFLMGAATSLPCRGAPRAGHRTGVIAGAPTFQQPSLADVLQADSLGGGEEGRIKEKIR